MKINERTIDLVKEQFKRCRQIIEAQPDEFEENMETVKKILKAIKLSKYIEFVNWVAEYTRRQYEISKK